MTKCPHPIGYFELADGKKVAAPCKKWDCPWCGKVKKKRVLDRAHFGFRGDRVRSLTLTETTDERDIMKHWARFRARLAVYGDHHVPKGFYRLRKFFWVKEFQENGHRHLHILINAYIPHWLVKKIWYEVTDKTAYIVWVNASGIQSGAGYLAKYLTKDMKDERFDVHERRYGFSRGCFKLTMGEDIIQKIEKEYGFVPFPSGATFVFGRLPKELYENQAKSAKDEILDNLMAFMEGVRQSRDFNPVYEKSIIRVKRFRRDADWITCKHAE